MIILHVRVTIIIDSVIMICISVCLFIQNEQLYDAAKNGDLKDVQQLIGEGADVLWRNMVSNNYYYLKIRNCVLSVKDQKQLHETSFHRVISCCGFITKQN